MFESLRKADPKIPCLNLGFPFDQATGGWTYSDIGEMVCTGGLWRTTGISAHGNSFKSAMVLWMLLISIRRYHKATATIYETEGSMDLERIAALAVQAGVPEEWVYAQERLIYTDITEYEHGNIFWSEYKKMISNRTGEYNKPLTSPFLNPANKKPYTFRIPIVGAIDSLSMFGTNSTDLIDEKTERETLGEAGRNMQAMHDGRAKAELLRELPRVTSRNDIYLIMTAHVGEQHQLNPREPLRKQMAFLRQGLKFKGVSEQFKYIPNTVWFADSSTPLVNTGTREPEYPERGVNYNTRDPDLFEVSYFTIRNKGNDSGIVFPLVFSQSEGYLPHLTAYHYVKVQGRKWGLGGNDRNFHFELLPDVNLQRTTVRTELNNNVKLQAAARLTAEMVALKFANHKVWDQYGFETMGEVIKGLKDNGFDLDILLNTRDYWIFNEHEKFEPLPFMSCVDMLRMARGLYKPYWYDAVAEGKEWHSVKRVGQDKVKGLKELKK